MRKRSRLVGQSLVQKDDILSATKIADLTKVLRSLGSTKLSPGTLIDPIQISNPVSNHTGIRVIVRGRRRRISLILWIQMRIANIILESKVMRGVEFLHRRRLLKYSKKER